MHRRPGARVGDSLRIALMIAVAALALGACTVTPRGDWSNSRRAPADEAPRMPDADRPSLSRTVAPGAADR